MPKMESIESLLSPSLRVSRPVAACSRCRTAKIKCNWGTHACSACERAGKSDSCTSANEEFARGNERSYVAALESAAQRLQKRIELVKLEGAENAQSGLFSTNRKRQGDKRVTGTQRKEASDVNELVSDFGFLTVNATSRDFHGFDSTISFSKLLLPLAVKKDLTGTAPLKLPPRYAISEHVDRYLQRIFVLLPFISETELMTSISRIYQDAFSTSPVSPLDFWYVRLVLAISYATLSQAKGDEHNQQAVQHLAAAMELADYVIRPGSVAGVQALLMLTQYAVLDPIHLDSWYLIGMASRLVVDLGLHCEPPPETKMTREELNMRRKVFYCTYALDRLLSMSSDRAFSFTDDSAPGVALPEVEGDPQGGSPFLRSTKPCLYLFDIRRVQSAFYQTTRRSSRFQWSSKQAAGYVSSATSDMQSWYSSIPSTLQLEHLVLFNIERIYSQLLVIAPSQKSPMASMSELDKALIFEYCVQYAENMSPAVVNVDHYPALGYPELCRTLWVGRQFLEAMWSDFDRMLKMQHVLVGNDASSSSPRRNCGRALACVQQITNLLGLAARRWEMPELQESFSKESAVLAGRLKSRQQEYESVPGQIPNQHQQQQQLQSRAPGFQVPTGKPDLYSFDTSGTEGTQLSPSYYLQTNHPDTYNLPPGSLPRRSYEFVGGSKK